jgi:methylthioribose-1-phosphate isomerase
MRDPIQSMIWKDRELWILDQRKLPGKAIWIRARNAETVARAIESLAVRGAPAIGIAAAYGVALAGIRPRATSRSIGAAIERLASTRPTGFNLFHDLESMRSVLESGLDDLSERLVRTAISIHRADARSCLQMAEHGVKLFGKHERVLTYCNTGALATGGIGTALGVIKLAFRKGKTGSVFACETRPVAQGARLTVWECVQAKIPVTLICDNMVAALMASGQVDRVIVGADRIARNGDTSNKIGTLSVAMLARVHRIPFHVAAPTSTFDPALRTGKNIPIEERDRHEVLRITPGLEHIKGVEVWNPAFDVTPVKYITSFITEVGVVRPPFRF